jgi:hypothetical protein
VAWLESLLRRLRLLDVLDARVRRIQEALGRIESRQLSLGSTPSWRNREFRVFSQWGEDGLIDHLVNVVKIDVPVFVEFGVEDYSEANTRFLLVNRNWSGLVLDSSPDNIAALRRDPVYWRHNLKSGCAFITSENINGLLQQHGLEGKIGLLSIDIDGNDYWVWRAIRAVEPAIVVAEYNARFGPVRKVTVPYDPTFDRRRAHPSCIYYGASLAALASLGQRRGYALVGCNSAGNNAFFVHKSRLPDELPELTAEQAFVAARFREARDASGALAFLSREDEQRILESLPVQEVDGT